uniref:Rifin PIR protein,putative n=1 Tax=Steinernema glaseri TaxID=37863 RepID=A0A1I7Z4X8_9BILA
MILLSEFPVSGGAGHSGMEYGQIAGSTMNGTEQRLTGTAVTANASINQVEDDDASTIIAIVWIIVAAVILFGILGGIGFFIYHKKVSRSVNGATTTELRDKI